MIVSQYVINIGLRHNAHRVQNIEIMVLYILPDIREAGKNQLSIVNIMKQRNNS